MIKIEGLSKSFRAISGDGSRLTVLQDFTLSVYNGECVTLFGPNGCGKSTLLKVLSGAEPYDTGKVEIDGASPKDANTGLVFQNYSASLYPWLTARDNILFAFHLAARRDRICEGQERLEHLLSSLSLTPELPLENYPYQLSGGQQQLVCILRTLVYDPALILMDEPFSSLDHNTRLMMQRMLQKVWLETKATIVFVSHDIEEAIFLGDRIVLLSTMPARTIDVVDLTKNGVLVDGSQVEAGVFERPRDHELLEKTEFFNVKRYCLRVMREERR